MVGDPAAGRATGQSLFEDHWQTQILPPLDQTQEDPTASDATAGETGQRRWIVAGIAVAVVLAAAGLAAFLLVFAGPSAEQQAVLGAQRTAAGLLTELEKRQRHGGLAGRRGRRGSAAGQCHRRADDSRSRFHGGGTPGRV